MAKKVLEEKGITKFEPGYFQGFTYTNYKWLEWRDPDDNSFEIMNIRSQAGN